MTATPTTITLAPRRLWPRARAALLTAWAAVTGAAPHVLHHVGPLAGTALVSGAGGQLAFGAIGFVATVPMLRRLRRRTGSWRASGLALAAFVVVFAVSNLVVAPALTSDSTAEGVPVDSQVDDHHGHDVSTAMELSGEITAP